MCDVDNEKERASQIRHRNQENEIHIYRDDKVELITDISFELNASISNTIVTRLNKFVGILSMIKDYFSNSRLVKLLLVFVCLFKRFRLPKTNDGLR